MQRKKLVGLIDEGLSINEISIRVNKSKGSVRHWLNKYNLHTRLSKVTPIVCKCGEDDIDNFYDSTGYTCKTCFNELNNKRQLENRMKAVAYKGGCCVICSYSKYIGALQFHHIDPNTKDVNFKSMRSWSWPRIKEEVDKCVLVCANCHAEIHAGITCL